MAHNVIPFDGARTYDETINEVEAIATRRFGLADRTSQGWSVGPGAVFRQPGNADWDPRDLFDSPSLSLNLGLGLRPRRLVNFEPELGFAIPLSGDDPRFHGGKVDHH